MQIFTNTKNTPAPQGVYVSRAARVRCLCGRRAMREREPVLGVLVRPGSLWACRRANDAYAQHRPDHAHEGRRALLRAVRGLQVADRGEAVSAWLRPLRPAPGVDVQIHISVLRLDA